MMWSLYVRWDADDMISSCHVMSCHAHACMRGLLLLLLLLLLLQGPGNRSVRTCV
jgi:hypothetical protein